MACPAAASLPRAPVRSCARSAASAFGRELFYDGTGTDNCFGPNVGVQTTTPADGSTFNPCPFTGANTFNQSAQGEALNWSVGDPTHEAFWLRHPHAPKSGLTPLEHYKK
jgi:hypothetical protein